MFSRRSEAHRTTRIRLTSRWLRPCRTTFLNNLHQLPWREDSRAASRRTSALPETPLRPAFPRSIDGLQGRHGLHSAIAAREFDRDLITDLMQLHEIH